MTVPWILTNGHIKKEKWEEGVSETIGHHSPEIGSFSTIHKWSGQQIKLDMKIIKFNAGERFNKIYRIIFWRLITGL